MLMLSNSLQWANKVGAQRKAAHPSPMGRGSGWLSAALSSKKCESSRTTWTRNGCAPAKSPTATTCLRDVPVS